MLFVLKIKRKELPALVLVGKKGLADKNPKNQSKKFDKWQEDVDMILE